MQIPEGASQRIHEDVTKLSGQVMGLVNKALRAFFSLVIFMPQVK